MFSLPHRSPRDLPFVVDHTALLLVDMQRAWLEPQFDPHLQGPEGEAFLKRARERVIPNQQRLLAAVREARQNVLHTIIESLTADGRDRSLDHKLSDMHLPKGSPQAAIIAELEPVENEIVLPKTSSGVFNSTNIDYVLRNLETRHLIIAGIVTDQCVDMAVRDAADRGYLVTLVEDACATYGDTRHQACLNAIKGYCWITDTDTVLGRLREIPRMSRGQGIEALTPVAMTSIVTTDLIGVTRGRSFPSDELERYKVGGCGWVPANSALTPQDLIAEDNPWGAYGDLRLIPDLDSRVSVGAGPDASAAPLDFIHADICETDGTPWAACPRTLLRKEIERYRELGIQITAAFEHEFNLDTGTGQREHLAFSLEAQRQGAAFGGWLLAALRAAGAEPEMFLPEYGKQQYEITCRPTQGLAAADRAVNVREITREIARQLGHRVSFAPKTADDAVCNGVHLHLSLQNLDGEPLLYDPHAVSGDDLSSLGQHWAAGVLRHLPALCAFTAPTPISYQRLQPHHWSASYACLGLRNREASLRICPTLSLGGKPVAPQYNLEFRALDATASPHLAMAVILMAGRLGLEQQRVLNAVTDKAPSDLSAEQRLASGIVPLPGSLPQALECLRGNTELLQFLPQDLLATYFAVKQKEVSLTEHLTAAQLCEHYGHLY